MARIIPKLNVNRTPQSVENNSLIFAKNIKLSEDMGSIVKENGFATEEITKCLYSLPYYKIVNTISTYSEVIAFVAVSSTSDGIKTFSLYRYNEESNSINYYITNITYHGGEINGTYIYNIKQELIITFCESNSTDNNTNALKVINLGKFIYNSENKVVEGDKSNIYNDTSMYNISPNIPIVTCNSNYVNGISVPNGVYQFFIRYKIKDNLYTKWHPIGNIKYILHREYKSIIGKDFYSMNINKAELDSTYTVELELSFSNVRIIKNFQIGYLLNHETSTVARIYNEYSIPDIVNNKRICKILFDGVYKEKSTINEFLEKSFNLYNVENIISYGNRLYISNYLEDKNNISYDEYSKYIDRIDVGYITRSVIASSDTKSLIPNQIYNFFIHYVRADGSCTNGIKLLNKQTDIYKNNISLNDYIDSDDNSVDSALINDIDLIRFKNYRRCNFYNNASNGKFGYYINNDNDVLFKAPEITRIVNEEQNIIVPTFTNIIIPDGFVGYFITYEKVENNIIYEARVDHYDTSTHCLYLKAFEPEHLLTSVKGNALKFVSSKTIYSILEIERVPSNNYPETIGKTGYIKCFLRNPPHNEDITEDALVQILNIDDNIYTKKSKSLIKLSDVLNIDITVNNNNNLNLPSFLTEDDYIKYTKGFIVSGDQFYEVISGNDDLDFTNKDKYYPSVLPYMIENHSGISYSPSEIKQNKFLKFSNFNLYAKSLKQKPEFLISKNGNTTNNIINYYIDPSDIDDTFELKSDYIITNSDSTGILDLYSYQASDPNSSVMERFDNTVRRSDVFNTESVENTWRNFSANNYKVITNVRGKITKLIPNGKSLLVHLEHSLFIFDRDSKMKLQDKEIQLSTPDTFDLEAVEIFTSENGMCGLKDKNHGLNTPYGYVFYDDNAKTIYSYYGGKLDIVSIPIQRFIETNTIDKLTIGFDAKNSRTWFCFTVGNKYATFSYNNAIKSFVSLHDYLFEKCVNTRTNYYLIAPGNKSICIETKESPIGNNNKYSDCFSRFSLYPIISLVTTSVAQPAYIIDVIYNKNYEIPKTLNSINYIMSLQDPNDLYFYNQAEDTLQNADKRYPGKIIRIYTDSCDTGDLDISGVANDYKLIEEENEDGRPISPNYRALTPNSYNLPWYDRGVWNFNYFRNILNNNGQNISDMESLIYGKYIVVRFIIPYNVDFKLENLNFNVSQDV